MKLGRWTLDYSARLGGSLLRCAYDGQDILRPAVGKDDPRQTSAFPMVPFIGRITNGEFTFAEQQISLDANMPPEPHAIHGRGWQNEWTAIEETNALTLSHAHDGLTDWPWAYSASQVFSAQENTLELKMTLRNESDRPMPGGLGCHPYFPKQGARLQADIISVWSSDDQGIIGHTISDLSPETDLRSARAVDEFSLDHCFVAGEAGVLLSWAQKRRTLRIDSSENLGHLTVYTPPEENHFCVEPVSHAPDAVNMEHPKHVTGLTILQPGETMTATIWLTVET